MAYADFVTAMMAFFLVMWLVGQSKPVKAAVAGYFRDPGMFDQAKSNGSIAGGELKLAPEPRRRPNEAASGDGMPRGARSARGGRRADQKRLAESPDLRSLGKQIEIQVTPEGLRIELVDAERRRSSTAAAPPSQPEPSRSSQLIARELGTIEELRRHRRPHRQPAYAVDRTYSNWELSADRANAARRVMERRGLHSGQIIGVRGYADRQLRIGERRSIRATAACR